MAVGKELDPPKKKGGSCGRTLILEISRGPFTSSSFLPNLMIRFGDVTYQIKGLLGDRNRSGQ